MPRAHRVLRGAALRRNPWVPRRLPGHHHIFNRGQDPEGAGPPVPVTGVVHLLSCTRARTIPDMVCAPSTERPPPAAREQVGVRQRPECPPWEAHSQMQAPSRTVPRSTVPCGAAWPTGSADAERTNPGRQPLLLVREQVKAESADLTVQTLSVAQGLGLLVRRGGSGG